MSIIANNLLQGDEGYNIARSLRFRSSASAYLSRTPASSGNRKTWTYSTWVKRGTLTTEQDLLSASVGTGAVAREFIGFADSTTGTSPDTLTVGFNTAGSGWVFAYTNAVFRDVASYYHAVIAVDTTQATASNRVKIYINGLLQTLNGSSTFPSQNTDLIINSANIHQIGRFSASAAGSSFFDGYLTEINFIDGQALTPSSFGQNDPVTGVWQPKKYSGTYGTNGFYLPFSDNSSTTNLCLDKSGDGNNWTPNNISVAVNSNYDSMTDVPTLTSAMAGNFCVFNPLSNNGYGLSYANLIATLNTNTVGYQVRGTIAPSSGKWYFEFGVGAVTGTGAPIIGVVDPSISNTANLTGSSSAWCYYGFNGQKYNGGGGVAYGATWGSNDNIGVALDLDNGTLVFYKNGVSQGTAFTNLAGKNVCLFVTADGGTATYPISVNCGQQPFTYPPPTGFVALNTFNLPEPSIKQGNKHFDALTYTGNGSSSQRTDISWSNIQPNFVWLKNRTSANNHVLHDDVRGCAEALQSNLTNAVDTPVGFGSDGFGFGGVANQLRVWTADGRYNTNANSYVAWGWKGAGVAGSSNTAGSITSTVSANPTAGFSVVTYTGSGVDGATIGHGLGVAPKMIITKRRNAVGDWYTYHASLGTGYVLVLQGTNGQITTSNSYKAVSSSTYTVGLNGDMNTNGGTYVAYCFSEVAGYSKFGSYTGNSSADGAFVYTGFRPRYLMLKRTDTAGYDWFVLDSARNTYNAVNNYLYPDLSNAEGSAFTVCDFLSNGFKFRDNRADWNGSGATYIYAAFAENPFKYSLAR